MPKRHPKKANGVNGNGAKMETQAACRKKPKVTWSNASDQIKVALAALEQDTEAGLTTLKSKIEAMGREAQEVGEVAKATMKREE